MEKEDWEDDRLYVGLRPGERSFWIWRLVLRRSQTWPDPPRANRCNCDTWRSGTSLPPSFHIFTPHILLFIFTSCFFRISFIFLFKKNHISFVFLEEEEKHFFISHVLAAVLPECILWDIYIIEILITAMMKLLMGKQIQKHSDVRDGCLKICFLSGNTRRMGVVP